MKKKYLVYWYVIVYDEDDIMQFIKIECGTYEDYESALIRAYELRCLGYYVKIDEE